MRHGEPIRRRALVVAVAILIALGLASGCGREDSQIPSAPDVSRAQPTGTVDTTIAR
jgi:hypothetical protein